MSWLSSNYDLPPNYAPPRIELVPAERMTALRHGDGPAEMTSSIRHAGVEQTSSPGDFSDIVAIYDDVDRTIYLPQTWNGSMPVDMSVLVHEMVHHLQNLAGMTFACPQAREEAAYAAQREWLALFERDLFRDFNTDPVTLFVRTKCGL